MKLPDEAQKFPAGELLVNERPVGNKTGVRLGGLRFANHVVSVEEHSSGSRFQDSHHHADRGGFAGAIGTEKAEYLSCGDFQIEPVHGGQFAVALGEIDELNHRTSIFRLPMSCKISIWRSISPSRNFTWVTSAGN